jgi:ABC-type multidrug transport system ATPase subunit
MVAELQKTIFKLKEQGIGILITDHNVRETLEITDRAYILSEGKILESGVPEEITRSEKAREVYLGERFHMGSPDTDGIEMNQKLNDLKKSMKDILKELKNLYGKEGQPRRRT